MIKSKQKEVPKNQYDKKEQTLSLSHLHKNDLFVIKFTCVHDFSTPSFYESILKKIKPAE